MLRLSNNYIDRLILSLRTGGRIGKARTPIINPNNLKIEGWLCDNQFEKGEFVLPTVEVRDFINKGIVVNDHDALTHPDDMIRIKEIIDTRFNLIGKSVVSENKKRIGKIADYAVNDQSYYIQKLYVNPSLLKGLSNQQLVIDRTQIVEITDKKIVIADPTVKAGNRSPVAAEAG